MSLVQNLIFQFTVGSIKNIALLFDTPRFDNLVIVLCARTEWHDRWYDHYDGETNQY